MQQKLASHYLHKIWLRGSSRNKHTSLDAYLLLLVGLLGGLGGLATLAVGLLDYLSALFKNINILGNHRRRWRTILGDYRRDGARNLPLLITPTATVCLMSRTAKRPRGGYSE